MCVYFWCLWVSECMCEYDYECACMRVFMDVCACTPVSVENTHIKQHISKVRVFMLDPQMYLSSSTLAISESDKMILPPWQFFSFLNKYIKFISMAAIDLCRCVSERWPFLSEIREKALRW